MKIDSVIANPASPGQPMIVQGDGWDTAHKLLFGDKPVPCRDNNAGDSETEISCGSGTVEVTIELENGNKSNSVRFTFLEVS